ncbi:MAG: RsmD family RNA methyltransferase [Ruminococcus bicirculans (ex Wegman et al. 2014)]|uniref:RsmD family RNA methyltransferase n=1 Tax=Ruminococcus bicirculans (ex Wegman et al. 2014) TaxID=1160721 RepID=UPI0039A1F7FB
MRVITGSCRGKKLKTLESLDTRPTTDMVKEAVFSIIQFDVPASSVLDLFCRQRSNGYRGSQPWG